MKKFLMCLGVLMCVGQVFADPFSSSFKIDRTGLQQLESKLQVRAQNIAAQSVDSLGFSAVEFLNRLNTFSKASAGLNPKLSELLYSALITAASNPQQSRDISEITLVNVANMLIDIEIIRDEIERYEITKKKEALQESVVPFVQSSLVKFGDEDDFLTSFA